MLVGAGELVKHGEVAISIAGQAAAGMWGLILVTIAAAFSTASAINATLFSTARLMEDIARRKDLPSLLSHENRNKVPDYAIMTVAGVGVVLASIGTLGRLVEAASLTFLLTFATVNAIAFQQKTRFRWASLAGAVGALGAACLSFWRLLHTSPMSLLGIGVVFLLALFGRPLILRRMQ